MKVSEALEAARQLMNNGKHWVKGIAETINSDGEHCYCSLGAIGVVTDDAGDDAYMLCRRKLLNALPSVFASKGSVSEYNDAPHTTWPDIDALFKRAIALAQEEEVANEPV